MRTTAQALNCLQIFYDLTSMYRSIDLVTFDKRTGDVVILSGQDIRVCFKSLISKASVLKIPLIPLNKGDFEESGSLLIKEG
jgi:hypothetical protein